MGPLAAGAPPDTVKSSLPAAHSSPCPSCLSGQLTTLESFQGTCRVFNVPGRRGWDLPLHEAGSLRQA